MGAQQRLEKLGGDPCLAARPCVDRKPLGVWHPQDAPFPGVQLLLHRLLQLILASKIITEIAIGSRCHTAELFSLAQCLQ